MEQELCCPVCREYFTEPVMLQCTHHICRHHLANIVTPDRIACPVCSEITSVTDAGLPVDRALQLVVEQWMQNREHLVSNGTGSGGAAADEQVCGFCEEQTASLRCVQCAGVLCQDCARSSHSKGFFKSHSIVPLEDSPVGAGASDVARKMLCDVHPEEKLSFYCLDCRLPVCAHCLITGDHKGHSETPIDKAYETGKETLGAWVEKLGHRIGATDEILTQLRNAELEVNQGAANQRQVINHEMDHLKELIETKRHQLLSKSALEEKQKRVQLQAQVDRNTSAKDDAVRMVTRSEEVLALKSEHAFLAVVLPLIQDMKKLSGVVPTEPVPGVSGSFRPLLTDSQVRALGDLDLGVPRPHVVQSPQVTYQQPQPAQAGAPGHGLASATVSYLQPGVHTQSMAPQPLQPQLMQQVSAQPQPTVTPQVQYVYRGAVQQ